MSRPRLLILIAALCLPLGSFAHHSFFGRFDNSTHMELEGVVTRLHWENPHVHIFLRTEDGTEWDLESGSPTLMQRAGIPRDALEEGMTVRVAAWPPLTDKVEAFATNVLLPDGTELLMQTGQQAYFRDEVIGDFGILGGGASGSEIDIVDPKLGTPVHTLVVASSEGHSENTLIVPDEIGFHHAAMDGIQNPDIRADMTFFETPGGGAVFSVGSIAWGASLPHNGYDNNVSRISANVVRRFLDDAPFDMPE